MKRIALILCALAFTACGSDTPTPTKVGVGPAGTTIGVEGGNYRDVGDFFRVKVIELTANEGGGYVTCVYIGDSTPVTPSCTFHDGTRDK